MKAEFAMFQRHPSLKSLCLKDPQTMNHILDQSFHYVGTFSRSTLLQLNLSRLSSDDTPTQSTKLDNELTSFCKTFPEKDYSSVKELDAVLTVVFFMIISVEIRGNNLLETYSAFHQEGSPLDGNQRHAHETCRLSDDKADIPSRDYPWTAFSQWQKSVSKTQVANPAIQLQDVRRLLEVLLECLQNDATHMQFKVFIDRLGTKSIKNLVLSALTTEFTWFLDRAEGLAYDINL